MKRVSECVKSLGRKVSGYFKPINVEKLLESYYTGVPSYTRLGFRHDKSLNGGNGTYVQPIIPPNEEQILDMSVFRVRHEKPTVLHFHKKTTETVIVDTLGSLQIEGNLMEVMPGEKYTINPGVTHRWIPKEGSTFAGVHITEGKFDPKDVFQVTDNVPLEQKL